MDKDTLKKQLILDLISDKVEKNDFWSGFETYTTNELNLHKLVDFLARNIKFEELLEESNENN